MDLQRKMFDTLDKQVYKRLDEIGIHKDCATRKLSWDVAAMECGELSQESVLKIERDAYRFAENIYKEAITVWDAIADNNSYLFD